MSSSVPSRRPSPGHIPPSIDPNYHSIPNALTENLQDLQISRPVRPPSSMPNTSGPRPPYFSSPPFTSSAPMVMPPVAFTAPSQFSRPGPPPSNFPHVGPPTSGSSQVSVAPDLASSRPYVPPSSQSPPFGPRQPPSGVSPSMPTMSGHVAPAASLSSPVVNGPMFAQGPPRFSQHPQMRPPMVSPAVAPQVQSSSPYLGTSAPPLGPPTQATTFETPGQGMPPTQATTPFATPGQGMPPTSAPSYGSPTWQTHSQAPQLPTGMTQPLGAYGMPPPLLPNQPSVPATHGIGHPPLSGAPGVGPSKIDPNQIPRPVPTSSVAVFETRQNNQANIPPPSTTDFIVKDTGNCSPRYMRCTLNQIPCSVDLLTTSSMDLAIMVQPLAIPHPSEEPIQVVNFGECGPLRCARCKAYVNPFMKFIEQGKRFICNLCGFIDETPRDYYCNLAPDGRRRDADERPELCRGTVEFVATKEYMVRDPMPAVFFFLVDVSMNAIQTGATAAACSAINQAISDLPEGPRTMVGIATFDSSIHFYNLRRVLQQPLMLIVPDVNDVYTPLETDIIVELAECRQHLAQLLESIPSMFQDNRVAESAFGAGIKGAFLAMKSTGGKLLVFQSVLPSIGIGALSARAVEGRANVSAGEKEVHKLMQPADKTLKTMAIEFAEYQVCVDMFITSQTYVDIASMSVIPRTTGGQVYYYYPFSALADSAKLYNDLRWNVARPQGFEAVMRVRCTQGLQVQEYCGNFCKRIPTDVDLPGIDCDKTIMVTFKHDDKFQEGSECAFQCALLYTTVFGQRRIRVHTLSLPCTSVLSNLFRAADLDAQFTGFLKKAANEILSSPLAQVREHIINLCVNILHSYRKFCATVSSSGQLILPEALKLLPLYTLALIKSIGLRVDGRVDDRSYWVNHVSSLSTPLAIPLVYPRMVAIHNLNLKEEDESIIPPTIPLSSEHLTDDGIFLLENGEDCLIYIGNTVDSNILHQLFGVSSIDEIPTQLVLQQFENVMSKRLNDLVNEIRRQRSSYLRLRVCKKGDPTGAFFLSYMIEDKTANGLSYVEFLVHVHRQIQSKMA